MTEFDPIDEFARPECAAGQFALQKLLDGDPAWDSPQAASHRSDCTACREELALAQSFSRLSTPVIVPAELSERIVQSAIVDRRRRRMTRLAAIGAALAASVVVAVLVFRPPTAPEAKNGAVAIVPAPKIDPEPPAAPKPLGDSVSEARDAIVSLANRTASETRDQSALLLPNPKMPEAPPASGGLEPLADARTGAARSVQPMRDSARRALNLFVRAADPPQKRE